MTYLSRELIRRMIIAEAAKRKVPPLLDPNFDMNNDKTEDLTDLDLSSVEATDHVDIDKTTKIKAIPSDLSSLYDEDSEDEMAWEDQTEQGFSVDGLEDFDQSEEESESYTVEDVNPDFHQFDRYSKYQEPHISGMVSRHDPEGRTHGQIKQDVFATHDALYKPPTKKSEAQKEDEFLKKMQDMIDAGMPPSEFPEDPEFASPESTIELPKDRFRINPNTNSEDTKKLDESINRMIRMAINRRLHNKNRQHML